MISEDHSTKPKLLYLTPATTQVIGGVQRFDQSLRSALESLVELHTDSIFKESGVARTVRPSGLRELDLLTGTVALRRRGRRIVRELGIDAIFHSFHWPPNLQTDALSIGFVHDLRFIGVKHARSSDRNSLKAKVVLRAIASWDVCTVPSAHIADDVLHVLPRTDIHVIGEGLDHIAVDPSHQDRRGVLIISGNTENKRPTLAKQLARTIASDLRIPVTTLGLEPGDWTGDCGIKVLHHVDDAMVRTTMAGVALAVATTDYEGFGLAVGEALRAGTGVVYDTESRLADLVGSAGVPVDGTLPGFLDGIARGLRMSPDLGACAREIGSTRTWSSVAESLVRIIHTHSDSRQRSCSSSTAQHDAQGAS